MRGKTSISGVHTFRKPNSDGLYPNFTHDLLASKIADVTPHRPISGEVEVDEFYFGARRVRGKKWRGAGGKMIVFGILKRHGKVYAEIVPNAAKKPLQAAVRGRVAIDRIIHSDGCRGYDGLVDGGYKKHFRVNHGQHEFARGNCPINGIESFWSYAKRRLAQFNGVPRKTLSSGIAYRPLIKNPWFSPIIGKRIKLLFRMSSIFLVAKKQEKRPRLSAGIIPCGST